MKPEITTAGTRVMYLPNRNTAMINRNAPVISKMTVMK